MELSRQRQTRSSQRVIQECKVIGRKVKAKKLIISIDRWTFLDEMILCTNIEVVRSIGQRYGIVIVCSKRSGRIMGKERRNLKGIVVAVRKRRDQIYSFSDRTEDIAYDMY